MCIEFIVWKMFCIFSKCITLEEMCVYVSSHLHIHLVTKNPHSSRKVGPCLGKWGQFAGPYNFSGGFKG